MSSTDANPYASPTEMGESDASRPRSGSLAISIVSAISGLAFVVLTLVLFRSASEVDRKAGMLFMANIPVLAGLAISALWSKRISIYFGLCAVAIQIAITVVMLLMHVGDASIVIGINAGIIFSCFGITTWAWRANRVCSESRSLADEGG